MMATIPSVVRWSSALALLGLAASLTAIAAEPAVKKTMQAKPAASSPSSSITTATGLVFQTIKAGKGTNPTAADSVKVHYRGTLTDGTVFDSSYDRGEPATFPLGRVIKCWTEGVQLMKPGGKAVLTCPPQIAYGERGAGGVIPPNATLRFEVELLEVNPK